MAKITVDQVFAPTGNRVFVVLVVRVLKGTIHLGETLRISSQPDVPLFKIRRLLYYDIDQDSLSEGVVGGVEIESNDFPYPIPVELVTI